MGSNENDSIVSLLAATDEELKGKLVPAQVVVDKETLVEASRVQNRALVFIYEKLSTLETRIDGVEDVLTKRVDGIEAKLGQFGTRIEKLEGQCQHHDESLVQQVAINAEVERFKEETRDSLTKTRESIECLDAALKELPNTIQISATQVFHSAEDDVPPNTVEDSTRNTVQRMDEMEVHTSNEIDRVVEWVTEQRKDDRDKLQALQEAIENVEMELKDTVSYAEVDEKISVKVRELVDQIKDALLSVEEDEADFKNVANSLHKMFNSLKDSKADKSEMSQVSSSKIHELFEANAMS